MVTITNNQAEVAGKMYSTASVTRSGEVYQSGYFGPEMRHFRVTGALLWAKLGQLNDKFT